MNGDRRMIVTRRALSRRTFLRGAGAAVALPLLDAMVPALPAMAQVPTNRVHRLGFVFIPMGTDPAAWTPAEVGKIGNLSRCLEPLMPLLNQVAVFTNFELRNAYTTGNHATSNSAFLSCARAKWTEGSDYELGTTVDQLAARHVGKDTALPSLELGTDLIAQVGNCDNGLACVYMNNLSWSSPTTPLPTEADPRAVFERLFGDGGSASERQQELRMNRSILDWVLDDFRSLQPALGPADRTKVSEYLDAVREIERRIQKAEQQNAASPLPKLQRPVSVPASWEEHVRLMFDLQVLALQADLTRVISFQLSREASTRAYPQIGVNEVHHDVSHHSNLPEKLAKLAKINTYHVSLFAEFLAKLNSIPDGDGSLLDHTIYVIGSGMGNPDIHDHSNLPVVAVGGRSGSGASARHIKYQQQTPLANLYLSLLERIGVHLESFADSAGRVDELEREPA
jgi:hypothetical protein